MEDAVVPREPATNETKHSVRGSNTRFGHNSYCCQAAYSAVVDNESSSPVVVLVADLREADSPNDTCARIIQAVREARNKGVSVTELMPNSDSALLKKHTVVVAPTVLILGKDGQELNRFEGESVRTLDAIRSTLNQLQNEKR